MSKSNRPNHLFRRAHIFCSLCWASLEYVMNTCEPDLHGVEVLPRHLPCDELPQDDAEASEEGQYRSDYCVSHMHALPLLIHYTSSLLI